MSSKIVNCLTRLGKKPNEIEYIILTHADIDHSGSVAELCEVIHTPGHIGESICLYPSGKLIFAGDALRSDSRGNLKLPSKRRMLDMKQSQESIRKIAQLEFDILLPGHGQPVLKNAPKMIKILRMDEHA